MSAAAPDPRQWSEATRWLTRADEDLRAAEALLILEPPAVGIAAFHCQQAAEKMAKAVLIAARQPPPRTHDIDELGRRVGPFHSAIGRRLEDLGGITRWYAAARYPDAGLDGNPTREDVRETVRRLRALRDEIDALRPAGSSSRAADS